MYGTGDHCVKWNKPVPKRQVVYFIPLVEARGKQQQKTKVIKVKEGLGK
jgi:hypothetical protein